jgi:hypothetical protein
LTGGAVPLLVKDFEWAERIFAGVQKRYTFLHWVGGKGVPGHFDRETGLQTMKQFAKLEKI